MWLQSSTARIHVSVKRELAKHFIMADPPASSRIKGRSKCPRRDALKYAFSHRLHSTTKPSILIISGALLIFCLVFIYLRTSQSPLLLDGVFNQLRALSLDWQSMLPSNIGSWLTFGCSLFHSAMAGVAAHQSSIPAAAMSSGNSSKHSESAASTAAYIQWTISAIEALQTWYDGEQGLWLSTGWWNSANCVTVLGDFLAANGDGADKLGLAKIFSNTFTQAQRTGTPIRKILMTRHDGLRMVESYYKREPVMIHSGLLERGYTGFINDYYDDEGWWALAWIRAYDVTGNAVYLSMAENIFHDMQGGLANATCGGGIWWNKDRTYKNAIANELYLSVAASLANRASDVDGYLAIAEGQWTWFQRSGMINNNNLVNDGLTINADGTCVNNGENTWSYNQGVILGGLVELYKATGNSSLLTEAVNIAKAAILALSIDGILHETCENDCGADGTQFKGMRACLPVLRNATDLATGIFMRNLHYLQREVDRTDFRMFILNNANSIWANDRNASNNLGLNWAGPPSVGGGANASTQSSALDALVAAVAVF